MRFILIVAAIFIAAVGLFSGPLGWLLAAVVPDAVETANAEARRNTTAARERIARESKYDSELNRLRYTTERAAYAYTVAPCNAKHKADLVAAVTSYGKAFIARTGCTALSCSREKLQIDAAAFDTSHDRKVWRAVEDAFSHGGISAADFPMGRELAMFGLVESKPGRACAGGTRVR